VIPSYNTIVETSQNDYALIGIHHHSEAI
jgi:hypothetical protein